MLLSAKLRAYFCKSVAIEMGGVSRCFSKVSGPGVDLTLLKSMFVIGVFAGSTLFRKVFGAVTSRLSIPATGPPDPGTDFKAPGNLTHHRFRHLLEGF